MFSADAAEDNTSHGDSDSIPVQPQEIVTLHFQTGSLSAPDPVTWWHDFVPTEKPAPFTPAIPT